MRTYWIMALSVFGLLFIATLVARPPANAVIAINQPSISIEELSANTKDLLVQSFDAF